MSEKFAVTFYKQWLGMLLVPVLGIPLGLGALKASTLFTGNKGFMLYAALLATGFWAIFWLIKRWALMPSEITVSETSVTIENLTTGEVLEIPFAEVQAYRSDGWQELLLRLTDGRKVQFKVNYKFYNPGDFIEMSRCLERVLRASGATHLR